MRPSPYAHRWGITIEGDVDEERSLGARVGPQLDNYN
jgi:hypothetical protein